VLGPLYELIHDKMPTGSLCDPFGGVGIVGSFFKRQGYAVWTGDVLRFAHCFQVARVEMSRSPRLCNLRTALEASSTNAITTILNSRVLTDGWFVREYSDKRKFFTAENAGRIAYCMRQIKQWNKRGLLTPRENAVLLASLINSADRVANTAGTYYAYLKKWHRKARKPFEFRWLPPTPGVGVCRAFHADATDVVQKRKFDVLYLDPPYNRRSHASYYHLPETIARGQTPRVAGKAGLPTCRRALSDYNRPARALEALKALLAVAEFRILVFHYADDGLIPSTELAHIFRSIGRTRKHVIQSLGYTTARVARAALHSVYVVENN
jgi:adenine-specific DNA-methyltransferase